MKSERRRTFVAREDLLSQINELAKKSGRSMYDAINETFETALKANEEGVNLRSALEEQGLIRDAREKGFIMGLENLWIDMAEISYSKSKSEALRVWNNAGIWFGKRYVADKRDPVQSFSRDIKKFFWNVPDFEITSSKSEVSVRAISPKFTESYARLFSSFLEGALEAMNFAIGSREVSNGSVRITGLRRG